MTGRWSRKRILRVLAGTVAALGVVLAGLVLLFLHVIEQDPFAAVFDEHCSVCHGQELEGTPQGVALLGLDLVHGDSISQLSASIAGGFPERGMPAWSDTLDPAQIRSLAIYVAERRVDRRFTDFKVEASLTIPQDTVESELHDFRVELVATDLDPLPYSIAPLPDGRILLTEKKLGLSIISAEGEQSELIAGTPETSGRHIELHLLRRKRVPRMAEPHHRRLPQGDRALPDRRRRGRVAPHGGPAPEPRPDPRRRIRPGRGDLPVARAWLGGPDREAGAGKPRPHTGLYPLAIAEMREAHPTIECVGECNTSEGPRDRIEAKTPKEVTCPSAIRFLPT